MTRKTTIRLSSGEYVSRSTEKSTATTGARNQFWLAVKNALPAAILALREDVYPTFERACTERPALNVSRLSFEQAQTAFAPVVADVTKVLNSWAGKWNCGDERWFLELAFGTLKLWWQSPRCRQELALDLDTGGGWEGVSAEDREFRFSHPGWRPASQQWADFEPRLLEEFRRDLKKYRQRLSALMEERGYIRAPKKHAHAHFEWLVLFHLAGKSYGQIANERCTSSESVDDVAIHSGVRDAARLVGIKLRLGRRGPRRKPWFRAPLRKLCFSLPITCRLDLARHQPAKETCTMRSNLAIPSNPSPPPLLTEAEVARITHLSIASIRRWRLLRQGPKFLKLGAAVRYKPEDVSAWLESRPSGGEPGPSDGGARRERPRWNFCRPRSRVCQAQGKVGPSSPARREGTMRKS